MYNLKNINEQSGSVVLIDALYVNRSGAKILLDYLIKELEKQNQKFYYLLDDRMARCDYNIKKTNQVLFLKATVWNRFSFYRKHRNLFSKVFCFGNIPPLIKLAVPVYTYFHNPFFASSIPKEVLFRNRIITKIKTLFLDRVKGNTDYWLVQSPTIGKGLVEKYGIIENKILSMPFYESMICKDSVKRIKNTFLYVSLGYEHKNHKRLIEAFCLFYDRYKVGELHLTISTDYFELYNNVSKLKKVGYPIFNHGFIECKEALSLLYHKSEFLIFPSLAETFGLGIIEAIESGCKVLGSDLPYMYEVCTPTDVFDPTSVQSIFEVMERAVKGNNKPTVPVIKNKMDELVKLLTT